MSIPTLEGITAESVTTARITTRVLFSGPAEGIPILFLHGNVTTATWWEEVMSTLPDGYRGIAPDLRGFGDADPEKKIDATLGMEDMAQDVVALMDHLSIDKAHIVSLSMSGMVMWRMLISCPERFLTATAVAPSSPYGFGGTKDADGTPCFDDYAGSGGGLVNPEVVRLVQVNDRSLANPFTMRSALRTLVYKPPFVPDREEALLNATMAMHVGDKDWPGDKVASVHWPFVAPGKWGAAHALSPKYAPDVHQLIETEPKVDILWLRGSHDLAVSEAAASDPGQLGKAGLLPGWPGEEVYPPQPMLSQTRKVLDGYAAAGGSYKEVIIADAGHAPFIEKLEVFNQHFHAHIS